MAKKQKPLSLMRAADGDWSLHPPAGEIKQGEVPTLMSGPARKIDGVWERPNQDDYNVALLMYAHHLARVNEPGKKL